MIILRYRCLDRACTFVETDNLDKAQDHANSAGHKLGITGVLTQNRPTPDDKVVVDDRARSQLIRIALEREAKKRKLVYNEPVLTERPNGWGDERLS